MKPEFEFTSQVFNLACECGEDPERVELEKREAEQRQRDAAEYAARMQKTFAQCPGFIGADAPPGPGQLGRVIVEPSMATQAAAWLRRRFRVNQNLELDAGEGLAFEVISRPPQNRSGGGSRVRQTFERPIQFELQL
jgi:hypothetical protein